VIAACIVDVAGTPRFVSLCIKPVRNYITIQNEALKKAILSFINRKHGEEKAARDPGSPLCLLDV
jgi:hypothetical protein